MAQASQKTRITAPLGIADKAWFYRMWEIIPGLLSWTILISPIVLSLVWPIGVAYFIIAFDLLWLLKSVRMSLGLVQESGLTRHQIIQRPIGTCENGCGFRNWGCRGFSDCPFTGM